MKNVIFHPLAEQELIDSTAYYEEQKPGLGLEFLGEIEREFLTSHNNLERSK
jgi:hypothetical protein